MPNDVASIKSMVIAVADSQLPDDQNDGLWFETSDAHGVTIRDEDEDNGVRITLGAQLSTARMRFHVDVNVGDPIWPRPSDGAVPPPLGWTHQAARLFDPDGVGREDLTASQRGITSTRWRDFADLYLIAGRHPLVAGDVRAAISEVAAYRNAEMGSLCPALDGYPALAQAKWHAWRARQNLEDRLPADLTEVLESVLELTD